MEYIETLGIPLQRKRALDFGCGAGRLTQAMADTFEEVHGVDIAAPMIEQARRYNRHGERCSYYLNEAADLKRFEDGLFDLVYTNITLQHIEPHYTKDYLKEFLRVLSPQGLLVFQLPSHPAMTVKGLIIRFTPAFLMDLIRAGGLKALILYLKDRNQPRLQMHGIGRDEVIGFLKEQGANVLDIQPDQKAGKGWVGYRYSAVKG
jgi:ubiquinone/menaquinone biosynthesis C-methylase UbiE